MAPMEQKFELRHDVTFNPGGVFTSFWGRTKVRTTRLQGQGSQSRGPARDHRTASQRMARQRRFISRTPRFHAPRAGGIQEWERRETLCCRVPLFERFRCRSASLAGQQNQTAEC